MGKADRPLWKSLTLTQKIRGEIKSCISQLKVPSATEGGALVRNLKAALRGKNKGDELRFQSPIKAAQCKHFLEIPEGEQFRWRITFPTRFAGQRSTLQVTFPPVEDGG